MNDNAKAAVYAQLLDEHRRLSNQISSIQGESIELNNEQKTKVQSLKNEQVNVMNKINKLFS